MTPENKHTRQPVQRKYHTGLSLIIIGFGVGWLAGLSVSPVVSTIITSLVGVVITLISALSGLKALETPSEKEKSHSRWQVDPVPIAFLVGGIVIGSIAGISARTQDWFGSDVQTDMQRWKKMGMDEKIVRERLFDREYPPTKEVSKDSEPAGTKQTALFDEIYDECVHLRTFSGDGLREELENSTTIDLFNVLPGIIQDNQILEKVVKAQCEKLGQ